MAHPYAGEAKASQKRRLGKLGASAGKSWGSSKMYKKASYPSTHAGSSTPLTISGGKARKRVDRKANGGPVGKMAAGGLAGGKAKRKAHHTTNIVIAAPGGAGGRGGVGAGGGGGGRPPVLPVRRPIAPALGAGPLPPPGLPAGPIGAPPLGAAPAGPALRPPVAPVVRPPGAPLGAPVGPGLGMKKGGAVRKAANGGSAGKAYRGFPHSPTTDVDSAVSAHKKGGRAYQDGGAVKKKDDGEDAGDTTLEELGGGGGPSGAADSAAANLPSPAQQRRGGAVKKRQGGGILGPVPGTSPTPAIQGPPTLSGRPARPAMPLTVPMPANLAARRVRPAPGTQVGFKKGGKAKKRAVGGSITNPSDTKPMPHEGPNPTQPPFRRARGGTAHGDEAEDRKLFKKMFKSEEKKEKD